MEFILKAGQHDRYYAPVWVPLAAEGESKEIPADWQARLAAGSGTGLISLGEQKVPAQLVNTADGSYVVFILPWLPAGEEMKCQLAAGSADGLGIELEEKPDRLRVNIQGNWFCDYVYKGFAKPFLGPIAAPGLEESITRLDLNIKEHPHQRSLWFSHGDVNGIDCWNEPADRHGREIHDSFTHLTAGGVLGYFSSKNVWTDFDENPLLDDHRSFAIYNLWEGHRMIDLSLQLQANYGPVKLGATKEAGPLGIRVAPEMNAKTGGRVVNAYGGINEAECWGQRSPWCDYSGTVNGHSVGMAIYDHAENEDYPTFWHVRDYGLFAANNFFFVGDRNLEKGESVTYRYRVLFHAGDAQRAQVGARFHDYVHGPKVES